jgi:polyhydroxyalkanoate synthesis repressor PhaR
MILIKRYPNRKLYNTVEKEYINLQDIGTLVQSGVEVQVVENATGEDITAFTLTQIITGQEKVKRGLYSRSMLLDVIRDSSKAFKNIQSSIQPMDEERQKIDREIRNRMQLLIERGLIDEDTGTRVLGKLILVGELSEIENQISNPHFFNTLLDRFFEKANFATTNDIRELESTIDSLKGKIDSYSNIHQEEDINHNDSPEEQV